MSAETSVWLNTKTLIGYAADRGNAWHYRSEDQGNESNHYDGPVPQDDVIRRLFHTDAIAVPLTVDLPDVITLDGVTPGRRVEDQQGRKVIVQPDTGEVFGVFSDGYTIHQYREWLLESVAVLLDDDLHIGSAGLLRRGAVGWVQLEVKDTLSTPEGVTFRPHLLAATSMDGKLATTYKRTVTNTVCDNTMRAALNEKGEELRIKHTRNSELRISDARDALGIVYSTADDFAAEVKELCEVEVSRKQWADFLEAWVAMPDKPGRGMTQAENKRAALHQLYTSDVRVAPWTGTGWGVMQAVNTWGQHMQTIRNIGQQDPGAARYDRSLMSALDGSLDTQAQQVKRTLALVTA